MKKTARKIKENYTKCLFYSFLLLFSGCASRPDPHEITSINIIDRNGTSETISKKERLGAFQKTDFLSPQPYQKVLRVYGRDKEGNSRSCITSYHPNGEIKQSLEAVNHRASGLYKEWYPNGVLKIQSLVIGGIADLNTQAEESWLFEGLNCAWDEEGNLMAEIPYCKGELSGQAKYYHTNGKIWKIVTFAKNALEGIEKIYLSDGSLFQTTEYVHGFKEGLSIRYWTPDQIAFKETYQQGRLKEAEYFDKQAKKISQISDGNGFRAIFGKETCDELQEYQNGIQDGIVKVFQEGKLIRTYGMKNGEKQGEEIEYFENTLNPKLLITWREGLVQGLVKTWYTNGKQESLKEMSQNKKNGHYSAWYPTGFLMFVEEYDNDKLTKGEYYKMGQKIPCSKVEKGKGLATLFDCEGNFVRKINYKDGKPTE